MTIATLKSWYRKRHRRTAVASVFASMISLLAANGASAQSPGFPAAAPQAAAATASESKVEAYPLNAATRDVLTQWQQVSAGRTDIRVAIDERTAQALVFAPPAVQAQIQQQLAAKMPAAAPAIAAPTQNVVAPNVGLNLPGSPVMFQLRQLPAAEVHGKLEGLLSRSLPATVDASGEWQTFPVEASPGVAVTMSVNIRSGQMRLDGPPAQVAAWRSVIDALDSPPTTPNRVTKLIATKPASHDRVRRTLQVLQADSANRSPGSGSMVAAMFQQQPNATGTDAFAPPAAGQPAAGQSTTQPAPAAAAPTTTQAAPGSAAQTAMDAAKLAEAAGGLLGPVQVEFVEGLDVIVLRGSDRDVQRVMDIIKQIEDLSAVTVPDIQIYELKYVDSVQMGALLQRLYEQVLGPRIGTVNITPLGKPNALLLIGRPENVKMAIELVQRLDLPVLPTARFEVFPLKHAAATEAKTLIDSFLGQGANQGEGQPVTQPTTGGGGGGGNNANTQMPTLTPRALVVADPRTNSLIVSASPRDIAEIAALVSRIDTPGASAELKVFTIVNGDATALRDMLSSLFSVPAESGGGGGGGGNANAPSGGALGQGGPVRMQFSVDTRTNSIIAVGSREDLAVVEAILLRLDEGDLRERKTTIYRLNNAFAQNVATALNEWLQTERQNVDQSEITVSPFEQIEREVIIVPELATNSLIVSATPRFYSEVIKVVQDLDERPPMVLIQVLIAQVQLNDTDQFGVELGLQDSVLFDRSLLSDVQQLTTTTNTQSAGGATVSTTNQNVINANGQPGFNFNNPTASLGNNIASNLNPNAVSTAGRVGAQGLSNFAVNRLDPSLGFSGFVFSASSDAVSVLLRALQEKRRLEVLSRPQLMALDGQQGSVQVGQDVPTVTGVNQTTFGQTNTIAYRSVGLILQVVPRISPDGLVVMQILANKSQVSNDPGIPISISTGGQVVTAPRIDVSQALTTISAVSGQTVVLGGLIETTKSDVHRRVPIIADIPLLGDLFRYDSVAEERRELLIILTPQIVYTKMDSDLVKQIESSRMSWILGDVVNLHGEAGLRSRCDEWYDGEMESIYPNFVPEEGFLPLSSPRATQGCEPGSYAPGTGVVVPGSGTPMIEGEPLPTPTSGAPPPTNDRYGVVDPSVNVQPATYQPPIAPTATSH